MLKLGRLVNLGAKSTINEAAEEWPFDKATRHTLRLSAFEDDRSWQRQ